MLSDRRLSPVRQDDATCGALVEIVSGAVAGAVRLDQTSVSKGGDCSEVDAVRLFSAELVNLSDSRVEKMLYDSLSMRGSSASTWVGRRTRRDHDLQVSPPSETHSLGEHLFEEAGQHLQTQRLKISAGTIANVSIINIPSSTNS